MFASIPCGNLLLIHLKHYGINKNFHIKIIFDFVQYCFSLKLNMITYFPQRSSILEKRKDNDLTYHSKCRLGKSYKIGFRY